MHRGCQNILDLPTLRPFALPKMFLFSSYLLGFFKTSGLSLNITFLVRSSLTIPSKVAASISHITLQAPFFHLFPSHLFLLDCVSKFSFVLEVA